MATGNSENPALLRQIIANVRCANCQRRFTARDVQVLDQRANLWALSVKCRYCDTDGIVFAIVSDERPRSVRTDLTPSDWRRLANAPPLTADDVIAFHAFIQNYTGDFSEIMDEPLPTE